MRGCMVGSAVANGGWADTVTAATLVLSSTAVRGAVVGSVQHRERDHAAMGTAVAVCAPGHRRAND